MTGSTSTEIKEWLEWYSKVLNSNIFLTWKWSWNINWINIWHACIEYSYISFIAGILHLRIYTGVFSKSLSEDTTHPRRERRHHQAIWWVNWYLISSTEINKTSNLFYLWNRIVLLWKQFVSQKWRQWIHVSCNLNIGKPELEWHH